jgi:hypothetical protein
MKLEIFDRFWTSTQIWNFIKISPLKSRVVSCGQTDMTNLTVVFHYFAKAPKHCFTVLRNLLLSLYEKLVEHGALVLLILLFIFILGIYNYMLFSWRNRPSGPRPQYRGFTFALRRTTLGGTHLGRWPNRPGDLNLAVQNSHKRQTFMPPARFEPKSQQASSCRPHALGSPATGIGYSYMPKTDVCRDVFLRLFCIYNLCNMYYFP